MSRVRDKDTQPEVVLRKALWSAGLRYRLRYKLPGKPDLVFPSQRIAVFVDGCFWHGCPLHATYPKKNKEFWDAKLSANIRRDTHVNAELRALGWNVLRFWEHEVEKTLPAVVEQIKGVVRNVS